MGWSHLSQDRWLLAEVQPRPYDYTGVSKEHPRDFGPCESDITYASPESKKDRWPLEKCPGVETACYQTQCGPHRIVGLYDLHKIAGIRWIRIARKRDV